MVNFMETYTGKYITLNPLSLSPEDIDLKDVAHHLSLICRFNGACHQFYSVAEHSVRVANTALRLVTEDKAKKFKSTDKEFELTVKDYGAALLALLHDAHEAYTGDMIRGWKDKNRAELEQVVQGVVVKKFRLDGYDSMPTDRADSILLATEGRDLMTSVDGWSLPEPPLEEHIVPMTSREAEEYFLLKFDALDRRR